MTMLKKGGEIIADILARAGINHAFSIPGSQVLPLWEGIEKIKKIRMIVPRNERTSAFMAEGYSVISGIPSVVISTLGPGVANELSGVMSAKLNNAPVLFVSPYQPPWKQKRIGEVFQGLNHLLFFERACKKIFVIEKQNELIDKTLQGLNECLEEPMGPVRIEVSFPLLFERFIFIKFPVVNSFKIKNFTTPVVVSEDHKLFKRVQKTPIYYHVQEASIFYPGIGEAGAGVPFALGAKLANPDRGIVLFTESEHLLSNIDSLFLGLQNNIKITILSNNEKNIKISGVLNIKQEKLDSETLFNAIQKKQLVCAVIDSLLFSPFSNFRSCAGCLSDSCNML